MIYEFKDFEKFVMESEEELRKELKSTNQPIKTISGDLEQFHETWQLLRDFKRIHKMEYP